MESERFDGLVKDLAQRRLSRLDVLRGVAAGALAGLARVALPETESEAKKRHRKGGHVRASAKPTCGKAGAPCGSQRCCGTLICPNGTCVKPSPGGGCDPGQIKCNGVCTTMDNTNCGACGVACQSDQSCVNGTCTTAPCAPAAECSNSLFCPITASTTETTTVCISHFCGSGCSGLTQCTSSAECHAMAGFGRCSDCIRSDALGGCQFGYCAKRCSDGPC